MQVSGNPDSRPVESGSNGDSQPNGSREPNGGRESPPPPPPVPPLQPAEDRHLKWEISLGALAVGVASTVLVALRLLSVADFNPATAYGIIQSSGTANVIIGTVISLIPSIAIITASGLIVYLVFYPRDTKLSPAAELAVWTSMSMLVLIALLTIALRYLIAIGLWMLFILILLKFRGDIKEALDRHADSRTVRNAARGFGFIIAVTVIFGIVLSPPWMPSEYLVFNNGQSVTGYVLNETQTGMAVLQASPREVLYYGDPRSSLQEEYVCSNVPRGDYPLVNYFSYLHLHLHLQVLNPAHYDNCANMKQVLAEQAADGR